MLTQMPRTESHIGRMPSQKTKSKCKLCLSNCSFISQAPHTAIFWFVYQHDTETFSQQVEDNSTILERQKAFLWWLCPGADKHIPHHSSLCLDNSSN